MKNALIFLLLSIITYFNMKAQTTATYPNETIKTIHFRKSVRHFTDKKITKEQIETIVEAGMAAPSAMNGQPWEFFVITEQNILVALSKGLTHTPMLDKVSAAIIVCGNIDKTDKIDESLFWMLDCSNASENILLAIESLGLGAVWTAVYPDKDKIAFVRKTLNIPDNIIPMNCIPIGYPTGEDKAKDKYKPEKIHWNKW